MAYTRINWENQPSENTPISAENLNIMDLAIDTLDTRVDNVESGWIATTETITYSSADSPSFVISTSADMTSKIGLGDRVKLTQTTVKYFIVTAITSTTITLYGGTDYTVANATISGFMYSHQKAPFGFPLNPDKWMVLTTNSTNSYSTPTNNVWWNPGGTSITIPIGKFKVSYYCGLRGAATIGANGFIETMATLSISNNSESSPYFSSLGGGDYGAAGTYTCTNTIYRELIINNTAKTTWYLLHKVYENGTMLSTNGFAGGKTPTIIKAVCAYL